jgi:TonB family protein
MKKILTLMFFSVSILFSQSMTENAIPPIFVDDGQDPPENIKVDKMPQTVAPVAPKYPERARKLGLEGMVWLKLVVDEQGNATKISVEKSNLTNEKQGSEKTVKSSEADSALIDLNNAAIDAAKKWKFTPAVLNGKSVKVWVTVPFKFKLDAGHKEEKK